MFDIPQFTVLAYPLCIFWSVSACRAAIVLALRADLCGPCVMAWRICLFDQSGPQSTGHPLVT